MVRERQPLGIRATGWHWSISSETVAIWEADPASTASVNWVGAPAAEKPLSMEGAISRAKFNQRSIIP